MRVVPRLARKRGMGKCQGDCGIPQPSLQSEDMPQKPLDISTHLFYPRAEEQQASLPGEQPCDSDAARIHKSVRVCSRMVHHKQPYGKCRAVFYCLFLRWLPFPCTSGAKMPQWGIFRARESPRCLKRACRSVRALFIAWKRRIIPPYE